MDLTATIRTVGLTGVVAIVVMGMYVLPSACVAATVEVVDTLGEDNHSELNVHDDGGENNSLTVAIIGEAVLVEKLELRVLDAASGLTAGAGCKGGGAAGSPVTCFIHELKGPDQELCGRDCVRDLPGTAWFPGVHIRLGDGENTLRTEGFTGGDHRYGVDLDITTGSGNDRIKTTGEDATVFASARPGGKDAYHLGGFEDRVTYVNRRVPIVLRDSTVTSGGESVRLSGVESIEGGSAADELSGGARADHLLGGAGRDRLFGLAGDDELAGGPGDDVIHGGAGKDELDELAGENPGDDVYFGEAGNDEVEPGEGNDVAHGGPGNDKIGEWPGVGNGRDIAFGGQGDDFLNLGDGHDRGFGGPGDDFLNGEGGADLLAGGGGNDFLLANHGTELGRKDRPDHIRCGSGHDTVAPSRGDRFRQCEVVGRR
jgi:Ca2+-binding RTX toxin-like protein